MSQLEPRARGPISAKAREALHAKLDSLLDARNAYRAPGGGTEDCSVPPAGRTLIGFGANRALIGALTTYYSGLELAAEAIGEDILIRLQPALNPDLAGRRTPGVGLLLDRLGSLLPITATRLAKHQLVALLWLERKIEEGPNRKGPKDIVGGAYGLRMDAIPKWKAGVAEALGDLAEDMHALAKRLSPEMFYALVFGADCGEKSLAQCA